MTREPRDRFGSWTYADELRWEAGLLRDAISAAPDAHAHRPPLESMSPVELEAEHGRLRRILWIKFHAPSDTAPRGRRWVDQEITPRPAYTSPFSGQDIWQRSG